MSAYDLTRIHRINLDILREIDRICRKYNIRYMMDSGTLLGAVRHKGFIPWDDDGDVAFMREHYQFFLNVAERELPPEMYLLKPDEFQGGRRFYDFTARIAYKKSQVHEDSKEMQFYEGKLNHLYVDLFVIDKLPEWNVFRKGTLLLQTVVYGFAMGHRCHLDFGKYRGISKLAVGCLAGIGRLIPMKALFVLHDKLSVKSKNKPGKFLYYSNYAPDYYHVILEKEWCTEIVEMEFEDELFMAPKGWHQVLTLVYGDYRKLPPKEKQVPTHSSMQI